jgi:5,5'-dehydrodivanillate O-demethylase oxygenase subunit
MAFHEGSAMNATPEITFRDFLKTGPDTIAGKYLRSFWQPVFRSEDVKVGQAKPVKVFCEEFAIYRGEDGKVRLTQPRCAHRGAKLSVGWVEGNDIKCAYHGWSYNGDTGQCTRQPAEPKPFCDQVKLRVYPVQEYLGLVFAYLGEGEPPRLQRSPEFETDRFFAALTIDIWPANYWTQLENSIDYAHTEFLHWHFYYKTPKEINVDETDYGISVFVPGLSDEFVYDSMYFVMPNTHEWAAPPGNDRSMATFARSWRIPVDDESHIRFDYRAFPFVKKDDAEALMKVDARINQPIGTAAGFANQILDGTLDFKTLKANPEIVAGQLTNVQDCAVMSSMYPMATREHNEMLGQTDLGIALLRRLWRQELTAFATGQKTRDWKRPASLWPTLGN